MTSSWIESYRRVVRMSWGEIYTRGHQELCKRWEFVLYRAGRQNGVKDRYHPVIPAGRFFFRSKDVDIIARLIREHLAETVAKIIEEADQICCHRFRLLGYDEINFGARIDWHLDALNRKRAPMCPWYTIPFLDFSVVGDHKITWELNRHQHLVTLAKAWVLTHDEKYRTELVQQWYSWQIANPFPLGINWASSLEVAFRSLSWLWIEALLGDFITPDFASDLVRALALNGRHIERYLSTYFSPNTHLLGEAVALFFIGTMHPEIAAAKRWRRSGWQIILQQAQRQVRSDGLHFEHSLYYHVYALDFFLHARVLAAYNRTTIPSNVDATLEKMLDVLFVLTHSAPGNHFGDDDGGRVFDPRRNRSENLRDPLALGAVLFDNNEFRSAAPLTEEAVWLFGEQALSGTPAKSTRAHFHPTGFEASGIYVMEAPFNGGEQMIINAGRWSGGRGGHCHADALSLTLSCWGRPWLVDPGTYSYVSPGKERELFRSTKAHNTLVIDGLDQADDKGPFAWADKPQVRVKHWIAGEMFSLFAGSHTGYGRLQDPVLVGRWVFHLHGHFWLVHDEIQGQGQHRIESSWHFAPDLSTRKSGDSYLINDPSSSAGDSPSMALVCYGSSKWNYEFGTSEFSPVYGRKETAPVLRASVDVRLPADVGIVIQPLLSSERVGKLARLTESSPKQGVVGYEYDELNRGIHYMLFSTSQGTWNLGDWSSDAHFVYCYARGGNLTRFILCGGTFFRRKNQLVFTCPESTERFEWRDEFGAEQTFSSNNTAHRFSKDALEVLP